jgi:hypothetical protein
VVGSRTYRELARLKVYDYQPMMAPKLCADMGEVRWSIGNVMVGVDHEGNICDGQSGVGRVDDQRQDVGCVFRLRTDRHVLDQRCLNVCGNQLTLCTNHRCQGAVEVPSTCPDIDDRVSFLDRKGGHKIVWLLPGLSLWGIKDG